MILSRLRNDLQVMPSPVPERPGLLIRDNYRYSNATLIIPPMLMQGLAFFDGVRSEEDLQQAFIEATGQSDLAGIVLNLIEALSKSGFLEDDIYAEMRQTRHKEFGLATVREAAHAGNAYPNEIGSLQKVMSRYMEGSGPHHPDAIAIAAPHVSPEGGWQSYRAAYQALAPDMKDRTFVILGTSHFGRPNKFGLTRKPFQTPYGNTSVDLELVNELALQPAAMMEDYCHAIEHSIEFQVLFLQAIYGPHVRVLPVLCGSYAHSIHVGGLPESDDHVYRFLETLRAIADREKSKLFWILGVDLAHMGARYRDKFEAHAHKDDMEEVAVRDRLRIERVISGDSRGFWDLVQENKDDLKWCGLSPIYTFMKAIPQARGILRRYEQWNIDPKSVVSFAGMSFGA